MATLIADGCLVALTAWYLVGVTAWWRRTARGRVVRQREVFCFVIAVGVIVMATTGPLDAQADQSLTAHMIQHVLLLAVAAPLLALSALVPALAGALALRRRRTFMGRWAPLHRRIAGSGWVPAVVAALVVHVAVMVAWHAPGPYDAAASSEWLHLVEHGSFVVSASVFWWVAIASRRHRPDGAAVFVVFAEAMSATALGVAMVVASRPWYPRYAAEQGSHALVDQQVAGVIMWAYGGLAALVVGVGAFAWWLATAHEGEDLWRLEPTPISPRLSDEDPAGVHSPESDLEVVDLRVRAD